VPEQPGTTRPGAGSREKAGPGFGKEATRQSAVPPGARRAASHIRQPVSGTAGTAGTHNTGRPGQRTGTPSGMAGTGAATQSPRPGAAAHAGGQFTQTVQTASREGNISTAQNASQQQNISVSSPTQGRQRDSGMAGTRYTSLAAAQAGSVNGTAGMGTSSPRQQSQVASASPTARQERQPSAGVSQASGGMESPIRHGRNAAPATTTTASGRQTARQEAPTGMSQAAGRASGTAGTGAGRQSGYQQPHATSPTSMRATSASPRSAPRADGRKMNPAAATAQQETARYSERQSRREEKGGADHGEQ
jgi:hypothetical protein